MTFYRMKPECSTIVMVCRKSVILKVYFSSFFSPGFAPYFRMSELFLNNYFFIVERFWGVPKQRKVPSLNAG